MGETSVEDVGCAAPKPKPTISVPPRGSMESLFTNGLAGIGFSPGPITLMSNFFSDQGSFSFSQLLAGAMVSPMAAKPNLLLTDDSEKGDSCSESEKNGESNGGYKRNRPVNLVVSPPQMPPESLSSLYMVTPGFSPSGFLNSPGFLSPLQSPFGMSHQQAIAHVTAQATLTQSYKQMHAEFQFSSTATSQSLLNHSSPSPAETLTQQINPIPTEPESLKVESPEVSQSQSQSDKRAPNFAAEKPASDGYNWRKYGQKHVKASECPRSYYKCTHINCPVKKKVERSFDGQVSGIVYKGHHNHDLPQSNKRGKDGSDKRQIETNRLSDGVGGPDAANFQATNQQSFGRHPVASHNHAMEDPVILVDCGDDDEPVAKRRSMDNTQSVPSSSHQTTITESKIVVQTRSEVDLLDDGYKWRKYGQKVVKGNAHPRSYYRCTYAGCNVRKHVDRASADPKSVITTYEGKHDHELPIGRYSNHGNIQCKCSAVKNTKDSS